MIKEGQIYKQKEGNIPFWRRHDDPIFVITSVGFTTHIINREGITFSPVGVSWINGDCELIAEYPTWQEAVNSKEFK